MARTMLTTADNPFDPFTQFDEWYAFDVDRGYNTCAYLARIARSSNEFSEDEEDSVVEQAVDEILEFNLLGIYKKVVKVNSTA